MYVFNLYFVVACFALIWCGMLCVVLFCCILLLLIVNDTFGVCVFVALAFVYGVCLHFFDLPFLLVHCVLFLLCLF